MDTVNRRRLLVRTPVVPEKVVQPVFSRWSHHGGLDVFMGHFLEVNEEEGVLTSASIRLKSPYGAFGTTVEGDLASRPIRTTTFACS